MRLVPATYPSRKNIERWKLALSPALLAQVALLQPGAIGASKSAPIGSKLAYRHQMKATMTMDQRYGVSRSVKIVLTPRHAI